MFTFWIAAALIAAGASALIVHRALGATRVSAHADPALAVYRRQLAEIDELAERGLIPSDERQAARAETARRLLAAANSEPEPSTALSPALAIGLAAAAPLAAMAIYLAVGSPNLPDQPFAHRLAAWRSHPERYAPPELAAALRGVAAERPNDPEPLRRLALLDLTLGDADGAVHALRQASAIAPNRADLLGPLGEILVMRNKGEVSPEAAELFRQVLSIEPKSPAARYYLARAKVVSGDTAGGLAAWRALLADLPASDPRRPGLEADIAAASATGRPAPPPAEPAATAEVGSAVRGMVEGLAARLKADPDNPDGWVRLVRAYTVLGETAKRDAALAEARRRYAGDGSMQKRLDGALVAPE